MSVGLRVCPALLSLSFSLLYGIAVSAGLSVYQALQKMRCLTHNISGFLNLDVPTDMVQERGYNVMDLISAQRTSNRHSNKDLRYLSWGLCTSDTSRGVYVPQIPLVGFMYLRYLSWGLCTSDTSRGVYVPCIYLHAR